MLDGMMSVDSRASLSDDMASSDTVSDATSTDSSSSVSMEIASTDTDQDSVAAELHSSRDTPDSTLSPVPSTSSSSALPRRRKSTKSQRQRDSDSTGGQLPGRIPLSVNCSRCRYKCSVNISDQQRAAICHVFNSIDDVTRQRDFIRTHIVESKPKTVMTDAKDHRAVSRFYHLPINGFKVRVCCKFFCKTLDVSAWAIEKWMKPDSFKMYTDQPAAQCDLEDWKKSVVRQHVNLFPTMHSRTNTNRRVLEASLNLSTMYENFKEFWTKIPANNSLPCETQRRCLQVDEMPSQAAYEFVFNTDFSLGFSGTRYGQCDCGSVDQGLWPSHGERSFDLTSSSCNNQLRHSRCVLEKNRDLQRMTITSTGQFLVATISVRNFLQLPSVRDAFVYKRKLFLHNATVRDGFNKGVCFVWLETEGRYGVNELGSVVYRYLADVSSSNINDVCLYIECSVQPFQKQRLAAVLLYAVRCLSLNNVELKFVVPEQNRSNNESLQSAVKHATNYLTMFTPHDWINVIRSACYTDPYDVQHLTVEDFFDLMSLANKILPNRTSNSCGMYVNWSEVVCIRVERLRPAQLMYKTDFEDQQFSVVEQKVVLPNVAELRRVYNKAIPISRQKKQDLMSMCTTGDIPNIYHDFYMSLPCSDYATDSAPDFTDETEDNCVNDCVVNDNDNCMAPVDNDVIDRVRTCCRNVTDMTQHCHRSLTSSIPIGHVHLDTEQQPIKRRCWQDIGDQHYREDDDVTRAVHSSSVYRHVVHKAGPRRPLGFKPESLFH